MDKSENTQTSELIDSVADTTTHRDRDALDVSLVRLLLQFFDATAVTVYQLVADDEVTRVRASISSIRGQGESRSELRRDRASLPRLEEQPRLHECVERRDIVKESSARGCLSLFPIEDERQVTGVLAVETRNALEPREAALVMGILRIVRNHIALLDYGERDTLTGLRNRKTFDLTFEHVRTRAQLAEPVAQAEPSWLGVVDIDRFKSINDNFGHLFGDEVLLLLSRLMVESFRGADQLFRFGGEEFVVVLDRASTAGAAIAYERLRASVEQFQFPQVGRVTISLGYTQVQPDDAPGTCVERADAALYYAKHHGRNKVCKYEDLIASGKLAAKATTNDIELF